MKRLYLLLLLLLLTNCQCQRKSLAVNRVVFEVAENILKFAELQNIDINTLLGDVFDGNSFITLAKNNVDAGLLKISLVLVPNKEELLLIANLQRNNSERLAFADIALSSIATLESEAVKKAFAPALMSLSQQLSETKIDSKSSMNILEAAVRGEAINTEILLNAIRAEGEKRKFEAVEPLITLLSNSDNLGVANSCLMALAQIKDARAVQAIIDFAQNKPALIRRQAILAIRQMPSVLAAQWLVVMAYGHDDALVRKEALEALHDVEEKLALLTN